jgi:hypothetical protein
LRYLTLVRTTVKARAFKDNLYISGLDHFLCDKVHG